MDNEAGMEHLSRATTENVDELLLVSDHSIKGVRTVARLRDLAFELGLVIKRMSVIVNQVPGEIDPCVREEMAKLGLKALATVPFDAAVCDYDLRTVPLLELPDTSPAVKAVNAAMASLLSDKIFP